MEKGRACTVKENVFTYLAQPQPEDLGLLILQSSKQALPNILSKDGMNTGGGG